MPILPVEYHAREVTFITHLWMLSFGAEKTTYSSRLGYVVFVYCLFAVTPLSTYLVQEITGYRMETTFSVVYRASIL